MVNQGVDWLNSLSPAAAESELLKCCGSTVWAQRLSVARPFSSLEELNRKASEIWWSLGEGDWLEAFRSHPKIGERKAEQVVSPEAQSWSEQEQSATHNTAQATMQTLRELNRLYEEKFGYIFIICATGKSTEDIIANLRRRLNNDYQEELEISAEEQNRITQLRLTKLLASVECNK